MSVKKVRNRAVFLINRTAWHWDEGRVRVLSETFNLIYGGE